MKQSENLTKFEIAMAALLIAYAIFVSATKPVDEYGGEASCYRDSYGMVCD